ncbi:ATP-dependent DNA helicase PIF1-like [Eutrema salsugineum]|uniref:ATP-dependent DNA helicase PIF1-like n=1 Tax=Eutrema salsugineum TaxID=72664 RepID=UPI000CED470D|nr:ATP-dependent DNA helicase PIF1-like [Eutrema salsugineum]
MPFPEDIALESRDNPLIRDERNYNRETLRVRNEQMLATVTSEQRSVYDEILEAVNKNKGGSALRSQGDVVLNVASSGIAALLLEGGRTTHSRFAIPIVAHIARDSKCWEDRDTYGHFEFVTYVSPRNDDVETINDYMLSKLSGVERTYLSCDSIDTAEEVLREGTPVMLLINIDPKNGLCNGIRLIITKMANYVLQAQIITGSKVGDKVLIPRIFLSPLEMKLPFRMRRKQFPITLAFAMTINKSQGQTLEKVGLYLPRPVFTHGQLYVAVSRVTYREGLKILITDKDNKPQSKTLNVVYKEVFDKI